MKVRSIHLEPFAGAAKRTVGFEDGLNVVHGPNEAGKSTLVHALKLSLFMPVNPRKNIYENEVARFLPVTGGDTIHTKIMFTLDNGDYVLEKTWGSQPAAKLKLPGGETYSDPDAVQKELEEYLGISPATWKGILFAFQSRLADTLAQMVAETGPQQDLAALLRRAVFETDGVRVEALREVILQQEEDHFGRWDRDLERPDDNRGIGNRWKRGVGSILEAYYDMREIKQALEDALSTWEQINELNSSLREVNRDIDKLEDFVQKNEPFVKSARKRSKVEAKLEAQQGRIETLENLGSDWRKARGEIEEKQENEEDLASSIEKLRRERETAEAYEAQKERMRILKKAEPRHEDLEAHKKKHANLKAVKKEDIEELGELQAEMARLEAQMLGGKVAFELEARKDLDFRLSKGSGPLESRSLKGGKSISEQAEGRIQIEHEDWELRVRSGDEPLEQLESERSALEAEFEKALESLDCSSLKAAKKAQEVYSESERKLSELTIALEHALEGEALEELKASLDDVRTEEPGRPLLEVAEDLAKKEERSQGLIEDLDMLQSKIDNWKAEYGSLDELERLEKEARNLKAQYQQDLDDLEPLPDRIEDADRFVEEFEAKQAELTERRETREELRVGIAELRGELPEESEEELSSNLERAEGVFNRRRNEGKAIERVREEFERLEAEMDSSTMEPWIDSLREVIEPLTMGRYEATSDLGGDELEARRKDGVSVPIDLLSEGTKVGIGLAIRLAMARYFLGGREGFLVMDDPLVDLDPDRQQAAAKVVKEFAKDKQVIVLTCQPSHADMLGGNRIELPMVGV